MGTSASRLRFAEANGSCSPTSEPTELDSARSGHKMGVGAGCRLFLVQVPGQQAPTRIGVLVGPLSRFGIVNRAARASAARSARHMSPPVRMSRPTLLSWNATVSPSSCSLFRSGTPVVRLGILPTPRAIRTASAGRSDPVEAGTRPAPGPAGPSSGRVVSTPSRGAARARPS